MVGTFNHRGGDEFVNLFTVNVCAFNGDFDPRERQKRFRSQSLAAVALDVGGGDAMNDDGHGGSVGGGVKLVEWVLFFLY